MYGAPPPLALAESVVDVPLQIVSGAASGVTTNGSPTVTEAVAVVVQPLLLVRVTVNTVLPVSPIDVGVAKVESSRVELGVQA